MPTSEIRKAQAESKELQVVVNLKFPPETIDAEGTVTYGQIGHVESKGVDEDGGPAGNVYWSNDEVPAGAKQAFIQHVLIPFFPDLLAESGISVDLTPTPFVEGEE